MAKKSKYHSSGVEAVINSKVLVGLVKAAARVKSEAAEIRGGYGASVKSAKENGLDVRALKVIEVADAIGRNRGVAARDAFLRNITLYADKMVEEKHWESFVGDLAEQAEAATKANVEVIEVDGPANANQPDNEPVPATDEQPEEAAPAVDPVAEVVASNVTKLRRGIKTKAAAAEAVA
jgi:hypothetical protein